MFSFRQSLTVSPELEQTRGLMGLRHMRNNNGALHFPPQCFSKSAYHWKYVKWYLLRWKFTFALFAYMSVLPRSRWDALFSLFLGEGWVTDGKQKVVKHISFLEFGFQKPEHLKSVLLGWISRVGWGIIWAAKKKEDPLRKRGRNW